MIMQRRQRGMTMWAMLGILIVVGFVLLVAVRLTPVYMNYWSVISVAESVQEDTRSDDDMAEVWEKVRVRFGLNNLRSLEPRETMDIRRRDRGLEIHVNYEERRPLIANVELVVTFDRKISR